MFSSFAINLEIISNLEEYSYCKDRYFQNDGCVPYCKRDEILGGDYQCYGICNEYSCESERIYGYDTRCANGYILGDDYQCHAPCGSESTYCGAGYICYKNRCFSCSKPYYLFKDGTCRYYE